MKIHRFRPWLRRHHTWAPFTLYLVGVLVELTWFPATVIGLLLWGEEDLKTWLASLA